MKAIRRITIAATLLSSCFVFPAKAQQLLIAPYDDSLFERATSPAQCLVAYDRTLAALAWRDSTMKPSRVNAPMPAPAAATLKRCASRLSKTATEGNPTDAYNLLYALGQIDSAWTTLTQNRAKGVALLHDPLGSAAVLYGAATTAERYPPYRPDYADRLLRSLDSIPRDTARYKLFSHHLRFRRAIAAQDRAVIERETDAIAKAYADWTHLVPPTHPRLLDERSRAVQILLLSAELDGMAIGFDRAMAKMDQRAKVAFGDSAASIVNARRLWGTRPATIADSALTPGPDGNVVLAPIPTGKPMVMAFMGICAPDERQYCLPSYDMVRRLHQRYGDSVTFVGVVHTTGNVGMELFTDPAKERSAIADWFFKTIRLPFPLIIEQTQFTRKPAPDGRVVAAPTRGFEIYGKQGYLWGTVIVDRSGVASAMHDFEQEGEWVVRLLLDAAIRPGGH